MKFKALNGEHSGFHFFSPYIGNIAQCFIYFPWFPFLGLFVMKTKILAHCCSKRKQYYKHTCFLFIAFFAIVKPQATAYGLIFTWIFISHMNFYNNSEIKVIVFVLFANRLSFYHESILSLQVKMFIFID